MPFHEMHVCGAEELPLPQGQVLEPAPEPLPQAKALGPQVLGQGPQALRLGPQVLGLKLVLGPQPQGKVLQELPEQQVWPAGSSGA